MSKKNTNQIGIAIITYNRPTRIDRIIKGVLRHAPTDAHVVVVNDGEPYEERMPSTVTRINLATQHGVAFTKNIAINKLIELGCEHIFIVEDDIEIQSPNVWQAYISAAKITGIHHLNYECTDGNEQSLRYIHDYPDTQTRIAFYRNPQSAFSYFNANLFKAVDRFDEGFMNAFEHIDLEYCLDEQGLAPPFWYFPDIINSSDMLLDVRVSKEGDSTITDKPGYQENWDKSAKHFISKHCKFTNEIPDSQLNKVIARLDHLQLHYAR